jgi:hypothetical protein
MKTGPARNFFKMVLPGQSVSQLLICIAFGVGWFSEKIDKNNHMKKKGLY